MVSSGPLKVGLLRADLSSRGTTQIPISTTAVREGPCQPPGLWLLNQFQYEQHRMLPSQASISSPASGGGILRVKHLQVCPSQVAAPPDLLMSAQLPFAW